MISKFYFILTVKLIKCRHCAIICLSGCPQLKIMLRVYGRWTSERTRNEDHDFQLMTQWKSFIVLLFGDSMWRSIMDDLDFFFAIFSIFSPFLLLARFKGNILVYRWKSLPENLDQEFQEQLSKCWRSVCHWWHFSFTHILRYHLADLALVS